MILSPYLQEAENLLLDASHFELDPAALALFTAALGASPADNPRLRDLLARKAPREDCVTDMDEAIPPSQCHSVNVTHCFYYKITVT